MNESEREKEGGWTLEWRCVLLSTFGLVICSLDEHRKFFRESLGFKELEG